MKKVFMLLAVAVMCVGIGRAQDKPMTFHGDIMDSGCAKGGTHKMGDAKACTEACVKNGSKYVLYDSTTKTVYQLDDQMKPMEFAGAKVSVRGTLDDATKTIHVLSIKAAS